MRFLTSLICLSAVAVAQTSIVFPSDHENIANGSSYINNFPFSTAAPFRAQIVYDDWDLNLQPNTPITRIGFRQDGTVASVSHQVVMQVVMGVANASSNTLSTNFDSNFVGTPTEVFPQGVFVLPALTSISPGTIVWVDLPAPHYVYPGGNLLIEFRIFLNDNGNQSFSYRLDRATYVSTVTAGVQGCLHSGGQRPVLTSQKAKIGGNWNFSLNNAPVNSPIALFIAPDQQMVTPYSLGIIGLDPSCQGQIPLAGFLSFSDMTSASGYKSWSVAVPNDLAFNDAYMTSQVLAFDYFSPGYLVASNADQVQFGVDPASSLLIGNGSTTVPTGYVYSHYGVVTLFN
jgi:hypothetical protein